METPEIAKAACARMALEEGVIDYIKEKAPARDEVGFVTAFPYDDEPPVSDYPLPTSTETFLELLPKPLPDGMDGKTVQEINPSVWYNGVIQSGRGSKIEAKFWFFTAGEITRCERRFCFTYPVED
jgi:hypothetical protein